MPGLVPGIHAAAAREAVEGDARNKSGHDGKRAGIPRAQSPGKARHSSKEMARPGKAGLAKGQMSAIQARTVR